MRAMTHELLDDARMRPGAERLRPDADPGEVAARAAWSVLVEPGDGAAGALVAAYGAREALERALSDTRMRAPDVLEPRMLAEAQARWRPRARTQAVLQAMSSCVEVGGRLLLPGDVEWPSGLEDLGPHAPLVLWARGDPAILAGRPGVAMVGARAATPYGESVAAELAGDLAGAGTVIISGGAYGIDGAAHRAALGVGGATIAFLAGGIDRAYPIGHQQLFERIRQGGAVLSEVPCGGAPTKWRFLQRNRLIAATGLATVVVEAGWRSGTLNTAGHAAALGRPIGAVPGPISSAASAGCHRLLREYDAICVTSAQEVRELWGGHVAIASQELRTDPERTRLLDALSSRTPRDPAALARSSGLTPEQVKSLLGLLALDGEAAQTADGWRRTF